MGLAKKNEDGGVLTLQPNVRTGPTKKGKGDEVYFSPPSYNSTGDLYRSPIMKLRENKRDGYKDAGHDIPFKAAKIVSKP